MKEKLIKWSRPAALLLGLVLAVIGYKAGSEEMGTVGVGLSAWALPFVKDVWLWKAVKQWLSALDEPEAKDPEAKAAQVPKMASAQKVAKLARYKPKAN